MNLFNSERKNNRQMFESVVNKEKNAVHSLFIESNFLETVSKYNLIIKTSLQESNNVYNEHVQSTLKDYTLECLNNASKILELSVDILNTLKNVITMEVSYLRGINKRVIETYEPLLKRLDRHKYGYQVPEYTLDNLEADDMLKRVLELLSKKFNLDIFGPTPMDFGQVDNAVTKYTKNFDGYFEELKRSSLGIPNSANANDFFGIVRSFLVADNNRQMKRIGDDLFTNLRAAFINIESIDRTIGLIQKEIFSIHSFKTQVENNTGNEYTDSVYANAIVIRTNLIGTCLTYIEDVLKTKITIFEEMCINYRKVIIDGYEKISVDPESTEGIYDPNNDIKLLERHQEYLNGHWVNTNK